MDDVYKLFKNERRLLRFLKEEFVQKFPSNDLADSYFDNMFVGGGNPKSQGGKKSSKTKIFDVDRKILKSQPTIEVDLKNMDGKN